MLTREALEDRYWSGLVVLRRILAARKDEWIHERGPSTSITESESEALGRLLNLGEMILEYRSELLPGKDGAWSRSVAIEEQRQASDEIRTIASGLQSFASHLTSMSEELHALAYRVREECERR